MEVECFNKKRKLSATMGGGGGFFVEISHRLKVKLTDIKISFPNSFRWLPLKKAVPEKRVVNASLTHASLMLRFSTP